MEGGGGGGASSSSGLSLEDKVSIYIELIAVLSKLGR